MSTSTGYNGKTVTLESEVVAQQAKSERESMFGEMPGMIVEFDPFTQKAIIQPLYKPRLGGVPTLLPMLEEVMVHFDHGLKGGLTYPVQPGDRVSLKPQMRNTELYHTEDDYIANDSRSFSLSDMEAYYEGGLSLLKPIPNFDEFYTNWRFDELALFGWHGADFGKMKCDLAAGEFMDTLSELSESLSALPGLSGNVELLEVIIEKTDNLIAKTQTLITGFEQLRDESASMQLKATSDAAGWGALASESGLSSTFQYIESATQSTATAAVHGQAVAAYVLVIAGLEAMRSELQLRRLSFTINSVQIALLSTKLRAMELRD